MKIIFNSELFRKLPLYIGTCQANVYCKLKLTTRSTYSRAIINGDIRFDRFVEICNVFGLNIWAFFVTEDRFGDEQSVVVLPKRSKHEYTFVPDMITGYRNKSEFISCTELASHLSMISDDVLLMPLVDRDNRVIYDARTVEDDEADDQEHETSNKATSIKFNAKMYSVLPSILGVTNEDIGDAAGSSKSTFFYTSRRGDIRMRGLVNICNTYHIDIMLFFVDKEYIPMQIVVPDEQWHDIEFHPELLRELIPDGQQKDTLSKLGYSKPRLYRYFDRETCAMTACDMAHICNTLHSTPLFFLSTPEHVTDQRIAKALNTKIESQQDKIDELMIEKRRLESQLRHLQAMQQMKK